jgi:RNA polymerase sigma-70 factor (ECF subfamily)
MLSIPCLYGVGREGGTIRNTLETHISNDVPRDEVLAAKTTSDLYAFAELYRRYRRPIYRYISARTQDAASAEDLTAQAFLKALNSAHTFRGDGSYRSWLFQIARNTLLNWRVEKARLHIPVATIPEESDQEDSPTVITLAHEEQDLLWDTVAELPPAQREVVRLRFLKDLTIEEIAGRTGRTAGAIRVLLHRSMRTLRKRLNGKDLTAILGATGAAASIAIYSVHRQRKRNS